MEIPWLSKIRVEMEAKNLDILAVIPGPNMQYLTGLEFHLMERPIVLLISQTSNPILVIPQLEENRANKLKDYEIFTYDDFKDPKEIFSILSRIHKNCTVGVERRRIRFLELDLLESTNISKSFTDVDDLLSSLRVQKTETEIDCIRHAVKIAETALTNTLSNVSAGITEEEIASELTIQLMREGSGHELPFFPIVSSGPSAADPHAFPTNKILEPGEILLIDWGASNQAFFSDITRVFHVPGKEVDERLMEAFNSVKEANRVGRDFAKPGVLAQDIDRKVRKVITDSGFGDFFIHRTGHGLGVEVHEPPYINEGDETILKEGMVFTIEPGIYLPDLGGIRIEDDILITKDGSESLTTLSRDLCPLS